MAFRRGLEAKWTDPDGGPAVSRVTPGFQGAGRPGAGEGWQPGEEGLGPRLGSIALTWCEHRPAGSAGSGWQ